MKTILQNAMSSFRKIFRLLGRKSINHETAEFLNCYLYFYGLSLLKPTFVVEYPKLKRLKIEKIFELCYVSTVYGFCVSNPKHSQRENIIRLLQRDAIASDDFQQLATFMIVNYNNDVLNDMVKTQKCTKNAAIMQGITNWLLLELLGNHQPYEVMQLTIRIAKSLLALTFEDLIEKQKQPLYEALKSGISLDDIKKYFAAQQALEFARYYGR